MKFEYSCGNVFEDLGLPNAKELLAKAEAKIIADKRKKKLDFCKKCVKLIGRYLK